MGVEVVAAVAIASAVVGAGATIYAAEQQKKAARKNEKFQKQQARLQAAIERARITKATRAASAKAIASGAQSGQGLEGFFPAAQSILTAGATASQSVERNKNIVFDMLEAQRQSAVNAATAAEIGAVAQLGSSIAATGYEYGRAGRGANKPSILDVGNMPDPSGGDD